MPRFRLGESDRDQYERGDEWFSVRVTADGIDGADESVLEEFEEVSDQGTVSWLQNLSKGKIAALRGLFWVGRRAAGIDEPWDTFRPRVLAADLEALPGENAGDGGPGNAAAAPTNREQRRAANRATTRSNTSGSASSAKSSGSKRPRTSTSARATSAG